MQGTKRRALLTSFGRVEVPLRRLQRQQCGQLFRPAERRLAQVKGHNVTEDLRELATLVGCSWPYETAAGVLKQLSGVQLSQEQPEWLQVGLDGGWVPSREQTGGMEGKIGVVAFQVDAVGKQGRHRLTRRRYAATFGPADEVGTLTYAAASELEATEAKQQIVLGDGADWIKTQANAHFPDAVKVLD